MVATGPLIAAVPRSSRALVVGPGRSLVQILLLVLALACSAPRVAAEDCVTIDDYKEFYAELMAEMGYQPGDGEGMGAGEPEPEDDSVSTGFKTEKSKSAVTAGKVLLSLQTKGLSDSGEAEKNYATQIENVRQGVSEAILQEQVPPGYHEEIKKYFDTLRPETASESEAPSSE